jgi:hypothetical protein
MSSGPRILVQDDRFRIVRIEDGERVTYVVEVPDGCDALGVERWREFKTDNTLAKAMRDYIIRLTIKEQ